jgi:transposase, IS30 family
MDRPSSTINRELRGNLRPHDGKRCDADLAHARARQWARRAHVGQLWLDSELRAVVQATLELAWSLEQIAAWLRTAHPDRPGRWICHETIYRALYRDGHGGRSREVTCRLRTTRPLHKAPPTGR